MATLDPKLILDDVRARDSALLNMLLTTDRQAVSLFRVYVTLTVALLSATVAASLNAGWALDAFTVSAVCVTAGGLTLACWYCIQAIRTATVGVPGRGAEFWEWATREDVPESLVVSAYLVQSLTAQDNNHEVNRRSSACLRTAKRWGVISIGLGAVLALAGATGLPAIAWAALNHL